MRSTRQADPRMLPSINRRSPSDVAKSEPLQRNDSRVSNFSLVSKRIAYPTMLRRSLENARLQCEKANDASPRKGKELSKSMSALRIREAVRDQSADHCMYALDTCDASTDWTGVRRYMDSCNDYGVRPKMQVDVHESCDE